MSKDLSFTEAVRLAESGQFEGNYQAVQGSIRGTARLLGAYGIPSDEWETLSADAGIPGARWQDPKAQDRVAKAAFDALFAKYGDWRLVAVAWKAGEEMADRVAADPSLLGNEKLRGLKAYVEDLMSKANESLVINRPTVDGEELQGVEEEPFSSTVSDMTPNDGMQRPQGQSAPRDALTGLLRGMRDRQRGVDSRESNVEGGGEDVSPTQL